MTFDAFLVVPISSPWKGILSISIKIEYDIPTTSEVQRAISNALLFVREGDDKTRLQAHLWEMRLHSEP